MNRRHLFFLVLLNALVSLVIALSVALFFDMRRPDPEELAAINTPRPEPVLAVAPSGDPQIFTPAPPNPETAPENPAGEAPAPEADANGNGDAPAEEDEIYTVQAGDSLSIIAGRYNITIDDIVRANNLANPDSIFSGQRLVIPIQGRAIAQNAPPDALLGEGVEIATIENAGNLQSETVLVVNDSNLAFSLLGWRLEREGGFTYSFGNIALFPGNGVRVHTRSGEDTSIDLFWGQNDAQWEPNSTARLINSQGVEVFRYTVP
jgi:LysM repeat protein